MVDNSSRERLAPVSALLRPLRLLMLGSAAVCPAALAQTVEAPPPTAPQTAPDPASGVEEESSRTSPPADGSPEIIVTGSRAARQLAVERKRQSITIMDVVSSDNVGKLPDYNPAEAIQRLPGVSTQLDQGEPRYAVIRGVDPNLNDVTIDGNLVGAPEAEGRRVSLDTIPSDLVSAIEVVKAVTPDMDANAIGGNINIVTPSAFDRTDSFLFASVRGSYNEKSDQLGYGGSATYGSRFGAQSDFGVVIAASYNRRRFDSDLYEAINWGETADNLFTPGSIRLFDYRIMRERIGGIANFEYRPTDDQRFYVRSIFTQFTDEEERDQSDFDYDRGTETIISPTEVSHARGRVAREYRQNEQRQRIFNISPGAELRFGNTLLGLSFTHGRAEEITPERNDVVFQSGDNLSNTINLSGPRVTFADLNPLYDDPNNYRFTRILFRTEEIVETLNSAKADLRFDLPQMEDSFFKVGAKFIARDKDRDSTRPRYNVAENVTLGGLGLDLESPDDFFEGQYRFGPAINYGGVLDLFNDRPELFSLAEGVTIENEYNADYTVREKIYAAYGMASFDLGDVTILGGLRMERTSGRYTAFSVRDADGDGDIELSDVEPLTGRNSYTHFLPGLHVTYAPARDMRVRAAWTNTIARPNYDQAVPTFEEEDGEASAGNPDLKPFRAMGFDLSVEHYPNLESIFSLALFYKSIKDPIFNRTTFGTTFNGLELSELTRPENADSGWLLGLEANAQYRFSFLPSPLDGFGASVNGTYVKSRVDVFGREDDTIPFFRQSKWIANAAVFYEKGPFEARVALGYRSPYLESIGSDDGEDVFFDRRTQIDAKASYRLTEKIEVFGSVSNLTDSSRREYQSIRARRFAEEIYGRTFNFGAGLSF